MWITKNSEKFLKRWEYQTILLASWKTYMQVKKQQLELDMKQQTGSKLGKEYIKAVHCHNNFEQTRHQRRYRVASKHVKDVPLRLALGNAK